MAYHIEIKYATEDTVFFMHNNKVTKGQVIKSRVVITDDPDGPGPISIYHMVSTDSLTLARAYEEDALFASKEELLATL